MKVARTVLYRPRRSMMYIPGDNPRALEKSLTLQADSLVFDLEDSVHPDRKDHAREAITKLLTTNTFAPREVVIRVNGPETHPLDMKVVADCRPDAVLVPKVSDPDLLAYVNQVTPRSTALMAMFETAAALGTVFSVAQVPNLSAFVVGTADLCKDLRIEDTAEREYVIAMLMQCVAAARANGVDVIDGVFTKFKDVDAFRKQCEQGRAMGFDGKSVIHPSQLDIANEVFNVSEEELRRAVAVRDAYDTAQEEGKSIGVLDGTMVERLHADAARQVIEKANVIAALSGNDM